MTEFPVIVLKPGREKSVLNRHPWLFSGAVAKLPKATDGEVVVIVSSDNIPLALGHFSPKSQIVARLFAFGPELPQSVDEAYWYVKLSRAYAARRALLAGGRTTGYRLIHAEGDGLPGIIADVYHDVASVQLRTAGTRALEPLVTRFLQETVGIQHVFLKHVAHEKEEDGPGTWVLGGKASTTFLENGLTFEVNVETGQKTGFFLDQRDNRERLGREVRGMRVANLFAYSGGFSVYALAGGATEVVSVDISASACAQADRNVALNFPVASPKGVPLGETSATAGGTHTSLKADVFDYLKKLNHNDFDAIVLDPPAFTKSIATVDKAARGYKDINMRAMRALPPGGLLFTFSCSQHISRDLFQKIIFAAAKDAGREVQIIGHAAQGSDHPVSVYHPEGEYLKGLLLRVW